MPWPSMPYPNLASDTIVPSADLAPHCPHFAAQENLVQTRITMPKMKPLVGSLF